MTFCCDNCEYVEECIPRKTNPQAIGCCDFGLFDDDGLIEDWDEKSGVSDKEAENERLL